MPALSAIQNRVVEDLNIGITLANADISSLSTSAIVSTKKFRNPNWSTNYFRSLNAGIYRPDAATASEGDHWRIAGDLTVSTGSLAPDPNWTDGTLGTETALVLFYGIDYQMLNDAINRALEDVYFQNEVALSIFADGDMQSSATSSWTGASGATLSKVTTAGFTPFGIRSLRVQNDSTNDYAQSGTVTLTKGSQVFVWAIVGVNSGTAELVLYDVTNSAEFGTTKTSTEVQPTFIYRSESIPATCAKIAARLQGDEASADIYWNQLGGYRANGSRVFLPSTFDERFKIEKLTYAKFDSTDALSINTADVDPSDYSFLFSNPAANPYAVQFHNTKWLGMPLFIQGRRPYSDMGALSAQADITTCPLHLIAAAASARLLLPPSVRAKVPNGNQLWSIANAVVQGQSAMRKLDGPAQEQVFPRWGGGV